LPRELSKEAAKRETIAKVHLKVDTGMGRIGHFPDTALSVLEEIHQMRNISVEGIFTHFSVADERDKEYTRLQLERFKKLLSELDGRGILPPVKHCANSAAILDMPETYMDAVRPGIILYGMYPSGEVSRSIEIKPVMEVKTRISFVKEQPPGSSVGYGRTYNTKGYERIAVLPVGYADGYTRLFSNKAFVLVGGRRAPVVGNICMDQTMIDVTHIPDVHVGDEVVLLGKQGGEEISAEELASILGTINYEVVNLFSSWRVGRVYV
ncbi:MAG: alanine racemase, partial [Synergistetes bacterium]|nr:alanine racemase [Synergistota bacterium]